MKKGMFAGAVALALGMSSAAHATVDVNPPGVPAPTAESCGNVVFTGVTVLACAGGYDKNLLKGDPLTGTGLDALKALGYVGNGSFLEPKLEELNSSHTINFLTDLTGITFIGLHQGSDPDNMTSFFKLDAGSSPLGSFGFVNNGLSNAVLFSTGGGRGGPTPPAVPEPSTWTLMLVGFGLAGATMRRRRRQTVRCNFA